MVRDEMTPSERERVAAKWRAINARRDERERLILAGTCEHGVYVAGGGRDIPCWRCEFGGYIGDVGQWCPDEPSEGMGER